MRNTLYASSFAASIVAAAMQQAEIMSMIQHSYPLDTNRPKRRRTGRKYPHSSKRQNDRIARQFAAGQISFIKHGPRV